MDQINHLLYLQETIKSECDCVLQAEPLDQPLLNRLFVQYMMINTKAMARMADRKEPPQSVDDILKGFEGLLTTGENTVFKNYHVTTAFNALKENTQEGESVDDILASLQTCLERIPDSVARKV